MNLRFITVKRFSELSGYSKDAVYKKISDGTWVEGLLYKRSPDRRILIDTVEYEKWVQGQTRLRV